MTITLESHMWICMFYCSSCHHHLHHSSSDKIQNDGILVLAYLGCPGKWLGRILGFWPFAAGHSPAGLGR